MQLNIINQEAKKAKGTVEVSNAVFDQAYNEPLIHQVVTAYLAGGRAGTKAQKNRSDVRGGGKKPWRQKGTGRARAGSSRGPIWRSGGATFAARPRDFSQKVNKKMHCGAMRSMLSELIRQERLCVVEDLSLEQPKTKLLANVLGKMDANNVLIVTDQANDNVQLAARNLINVNVMTAKHVDPVSLVNFEKVLVTVAALKQLEESLA